MNPTEELFKIAFDVLFSKTGDKFNIFLCKLKLFFKDFQLKLKYLVSFFILFKIKLENVAIFFEMLPYFSANITYDHKKNPQKQQEDHDGLVTLTGVS